MTPRAAILAGGKASRMGGAPKGLIEIGGRRILDRLVDAAVAAFGAPPLLIGMIDRGDLDAVLVLDPFISQMLETDKYRSIGNLGEIWRQKTNQNPMLVSVTVDETWAKANPDVVKRFVAAFKEALTYLKNTPEAWKELAQGMGLKTDRGVKILYERTADAIIIRWDKKLIDEQYAYAAELYKTFGKQADVPERVPDGTFDLSYVP